MRFKTEDKIGVIADALPTMEYHSFEEVLWNEEDTFLSGVGEWKKIFVNVPVFREANHKRRMHRAYKKGGIPALVKYMEPFVDKENLKQLAEQLKQHIG